MMNSKICILGSTGMVGSNIVKKLKGLGYKNILTPTRVDLNLLNNIEVKYYFKGHKIDYVFQCAALVGGIYANNKFPVDFLYQNSMINLNVINHAAENGVKKIINLGSSCIYPKNCPQPIKEEYLLTSPLEATNEAYAIAKIMSIKLCEAYNKQYNTNFINLMPCSLYGIGDNFNPENSHLIPALIRKFQEAKISNQNYVEIWGDGTPLREFLNVEDFAEIAIELAKNYNSTELLNVGSGIENSIAEIAEIVKEVVGFKGILGYNHTKPNGTMRKLLDCSKLKNITEWKPKIRLKEGVGALYENWRTV